MTSPLYNNGCQPLPFESRTYGLANSVLDFCIQPRILERPVCPVTPLLQEPNIRSARHFDYTSVRAVYMFHIVNLFEF